VRKTANDDVAKRKDDIFDQYLEDPDWGELFGTLSVLNADVRCNAKSGSAGEYRTILGSISFRGGSWRGMSPN
jgi:hypothetical protein